MKIKFILLFTAICFSLKLFAQRDTIPINANWKFAIDLKGEGIAQSWNIKDLAHLKSVNLPHTWNVEEATQNHYGWGWYRYTLKVPTEWKNKNVVIQFGAINHTSKIYINGKEVLESIGDGFNQIKVNLNDKISYGKENIITVAVNNAYNEKKVPFSNSFDWANDGGKIGRAHV